MGAIDTITSFLSALGGLFDSVGGAVPVVTSLVIVVVIAVGTIATIYCAMEEKWFSAIVSGVLTVIFFLSRAVF